MYLTYCSNCVLFKIAKRAWTSFSANVKFFDSEPCRQLLDTRFDGSSAAITLCRLSP
jgi:hypothetical protein